MKEIYLTLFAVTAMTICCFGNTNTVETGIKKAGKKVGKKSGEKVAQIKKTEQKKKNPIAVVETSMGTFKFKFFEEKAPATCKNFIDLSNKGFYNGLIFHRIIPGFMIQGGCPLGKGIGGPGYKIKAEFNDTKHLPGIVSMARSQHPDSAGSQFFVCVAPASYLDGKYTAFGEVIEGYDVVDKIGKVETGRNDKPIKDVIINKITIQ